MQIINLEESELTNIPWASLSPSDVHKIVQSALLENPTVTLYHPEYGPYLQKWLIDRRLDGSARYVHRFLRPDADDYLHDHPWDNRTICYAVGYVEEMRDTSLRVTPGSIIERLATDYHRVVFDAGPCPVTIFEHGPKINLWGFLGRDGAKIPWDEFVAETGAYRR